MTARSAFISFEGIDGSGKSTQLDLLAERLRAEGHEVLLTREPGGSPGAEEIRALVLQGDPDRWSAETELLLFTAHDAIILNAPFCLHLRPVRSCSVTGLPTLPVCIKA